MKQPKKVIQHVGLVANLEKNRSLALARDAATWLQSKGCSVTIDAETATKFPHPRVAAHLKELAAKSDLILVIGGDGTMLRVAREVAGLDVPILGINSGNLGFLTAVTPSKLGAALQKVVDGAFSLDARSLLEAEVHRSADVKKLTALNDLVISRSMASRLIELEVLVNDELLTRYRCDGLIASSPTGSTAYSLAAGGAIVSPDAHVMLLTPICPHTLSIRPLVLNLDAVVQVRLVSPKLVATLAVDGQEQTELRRGDFVLIRRSRRPVHLLRLEGMTFFSTLRQKFAWSGTNV